MTTPPDILLGLSPADRAELTRLLVEQVEADRVLTEVIASPATTAGDIRSIRAIGQATKNCGRSTRRIAAWTRARLALIAAQGPRSTVAL